MNKHINIAIFASGTGSNARKIIEYFQTNSSIQVSLVISNRATATVLEMAQSYDVPTHVITRQSFYKTDSILTLLKKVDWVVLAGFLWLIPPYLVKAFPKGIVNIHPALLPKYGGKGMYGAHIHKAVKAAHEKKSGISIHFVNEAYDEGQLIFQVSCPITSQDTAEDIAQKVLTLEHQHFAPTLEQLLLNRIRL